MNNLEQILEAAILAAEKPLSLDQLVMLFDEYDRPSRKDIKDALDAVMLGCADRGFELVEVASGYRFQVKSEYSEWVGRLWEEKPQRYSRALLETLALIAYRQPITRGDIEDIRGVAVSSNIMKTLMEREWVRIVGHKDVPGRPAMYATTKQFLDYFGLTTLSELPPLSEIRDLEIIEQELEKSLLDAVDGLETDSESNKDDLNEPQDAQDGSTLH
ncbi:chromosome segregation and condensation protein ScpB [Oleiphilus messinensis]|uniref:Chromosome segregation and condensation protein ScpB n=1 Tax=Oleiphilus messinensis TaxID=141451 RepID=A0A1Y0IDB5_9GAMM|nr:SMC-Scp complex subunit ScpB [Oleiphilus messinensis]ARU57465.1 chromosome segregation and condensation protein ScpB [Oleiphilus messinensis]